MIKAKKLLSFIVALLLGGILIFSLLAGRLFYGPVSIKYLTGSLKTQIEKVFLDLDFEFQETMINWNKGIGTLELQLSNLKVKSKESTLNATFPFVGITFSKQALYKGELYASKFEFISPTITIDWSAKTFVEKIRMAFSESHNQKELLDVISAPESHDSFINGPLDKLLRALNKQEMFVHLLNMEIRGGNLTLIENTSQTEWKSPDARISFNRLQKGFDLSFNLTLSSLNKSANIEGVTNVSPKGEKLLSISFQNINLASLSRSVNFPVNFQALDVPLYGETNMLFIKEQLKKVNFDISGGPGFLFLPSIFFTPPNIDGIEIKGFFDFNNKVIEFSDFNIELGDAFLKGVGLIELGNEQGPSFNFITDLQNMEIRNLLKYWPPKISKGGYKWIDNNISKGFITTAKIVIDIRPEDLKVKPLPEKSFRADFQFKDVNANYLNPMPFIERASGYGNVSSNYLEVNIKKGRSFDIDFGNSVFKIENMASRENRFGRVHLNTRSRIRKALKFVNHKPLSLATKFGIDPMSVLGDISITANLGFPIIKGVSLNNVNINADAKLINISMPGLLSNGGLQNTNLDLVITREGFNASGEIELKGAPFELLWTEVFKTKNKNEFPSTYDLRGTLNKKQLVNFGIPVEDIMSGSVRTRMVVQGRGSRLMKGHAETDLFPGAFKSVLLGWEKKINTPGRVKFDLEWTTNEFKLNNIIADTVGLYTKGNVAFNRNTPEIIEAKFTEFKTLENDLTLMAKGSFEKGFNLVVDGTTLGVGPLLESLSTGKGPRKIPPLTMLLRVNKAIGLNGVSLSDFELSAHNGGDFWEWADASGELDEGTNFDFKLSKSDEPGGRDLKLTSNNAGRLALAAGLFINGEGGEVELSAHLNDRYQDGLIQGELLINDFRLVKSSALVKALEVAKSNGFDSVIGENGISFSELDIPFVLREGIIDITNANAHGPSIGFTMQGQVDQSMKEINVNGVILPVYVLNSLLGSIPIVGNILTGGDGGLFGVNYRVEGKTSDAKVSISTLSAFAPGFLRKIFQGKKGKLAPNQIKKFDKNKEPNNLHLN